MRRYCFNLVIFLLWANTAVNAQVNSSQQILFKQIYSAAENEYGTHQELINGVLFEKAHQDVTGHPYLLDYYSNTGSVIYKGKKYSNLNLRYDIYDQQLLLIYRFDSIEYKLYLQKEFITEFNIDNKKYILEAFHPGEETRIYQVLGEDLPTRILYFWQKGVSNLYANNSDRKAFSPAQKEPYILMNNQLASYRGNRSFTRKFALDLRTGIKAYLRKNKMKVKHATDNEMERLIQIINSLDG